jgi:hypothetical protein
MTSPIRRGPLALTLAAALALAPSARADGATPATADVAPAAAPAAGSSGPASSSYLLVVNDYLLGLQFYASGTRQLTPAVGLTVETYFTEGNPVASGSTSWLAEVDAGPTFTVRSVTLTATAGIAFDWAAKKPIAFLPQLYTTARVGRWYVESWAYGVFFSAFDATANDYLHTRDWLLYDAGAGVSVGPQVEATYNLAGKYGAEGLVSLPLGARVDVALGAGNTLGLFLGYETRDVSRGPSNEGAVGRVSFLHNF